VAGNDAALRIDQDRIGPAEFDDRGCDLRHLVVVVSPGIARTGSADRAANARPRRAVAVSFGSAMHRGGW
jgi:hypothetical protein